jgi:hypothetical protein
MLPYLLLGLLFSQMEMPTTRTVGVKRAAEHLSLDSFSEDLTCGICLSICVQPASLTCGHNFCQSCLHRAADVNEGLLRSCPSCRGKARRVPAVNRPLAALCAAVEANARWKCALHSRPMEYYCRCCDTHVCDRCGLFGAHKGHEIVEREEVGRASEANLAAASQLVHERHQAYAAAAQRVDGLFVGLRTRVASVAEAAKAAVETLQRSVETKLRAEQRRAQATLARRSLPLLQAELSLDILMQQLPRLDGQQRLLQEALREARAAPGPPELDSLAAAERLDGEEGLRCLERLVEMGGTRRVQVLVQLTVPRRRTIAIESTLPELTLELIEGKIRQKMGLSAHVQCCLYASCRPIVDDEQLRFLVRTGRTLELRVRAQPQEPASSIGLERENDEGKGKGRGGNTSRPKRHSSRGNYNKVKGQGRN